MQYTEGGFPSNMNCSNAVTRSADTMTNPCNHDEISQDKWTQNFHPKEKKKHSSINLEHACGENETMLARFISLETTFKNNLRG